jgi:hypothetical protein
MSDYRPSSASDKAKPNGGQNLPIVPQISRAERHKVENCTKGNNCQRSELSEYWVGAVIRNRIWKLRDIGWRRERVRFASPFQVSLMAVQLAV